MQKLTCLFRSRWPEECGDFSFSRFFKTTEAVLFPVNSAPKFCPEIGVDEIIESVSDLERISEDNFRGGGLFFVSADSFFGGSEVAGPLFDSVEIWSSSAQPKFRYFDKISASVTRDSSRILVAKINRPVSLLLVSISSVFSWISPLNWKIVLATLLVVSKISIASIEKNFSFLLIPFNW